MIITANDKLLQNQYNKITTHQASVSTSVKLIWKSTLFGPHIRICGWKPELSA